MTVAVGFSWQETTQIFFCTLIRSVKYTKEICDENRWQLLDDFDMENI